MEVLVGPTFSIEVSSPPPYVVPSSQDKHHHTSAAAASPPCIFLKQEEDDDNGGSALSLISSRISQEDSSDSSSSIGAPDDSEEDEEEVDSLVPSSKGGLSSLDSLEDSLPIKRGLSNHFTGKSKSFANLSDMSCVSTAKDLEKPENPFNKRRRLVMANKWYKKSSFYSWANPKSMPLLVSLDEEEKDDHQQQQQQQREDEASPSSSSSEQDQPQNIAPKLSKLQERKFNNSFKSHSCFSLTDLQQ